jgi:tetratricopeptide (TPR) repeat protein
MWHLIVPPIVVVICFVFIVWYLSLRGSDPEVAEQVETMGDAHGSAFRLRMKIFSLRVLEKLAQRFKLLSLRVYNGFHVFLQSVKEKRKLSDMQQQELESVAQEKSFVLEEDAPIQSNDVSQETGRYVAEGKMVEQQDVADRNITQGTNAHSPEASSAESLPSEVKAASFNIAVPLRRRHKEEDVHNTDSLVLIRPMISEQVARPEKLKRKVLERPAEEELIGRIATNPKDYTAYEALGDFYMERGSIQDAKECYKQVLKLSPVQRLVKIKIRRLERLLSQK